MIKNTEKNQNSGLTQKFHRNFKWSMFGSVSYEALKIIHQLLLLKVLHSIVYGLVGSIFSIIYLTVYVSEFGLGYSLSPFLNIFIKNKQNFKKVFVKWYLLPQLFIIAIAMLVTTFFYSKSAFNNQDSPITLLIPIIIATESIRIFFRRFLHNVFESKPTVILEIILMTFYFCIVWIPYLFFNVKLSLNFIFSTYLLDSFLGMTSLLFLAIRFYKKLPQAELQIPPNLFKRILKTRIYNHSIQVTKNLFTGNFLTPLFATTFGFGSAGILNIANHISESFKAIIKTTIIFSGNALFASLKNNELRIKKEAFKLLCLKLNKIIYPIIIFLTLNFHAILHTSYLSSISKSTIIFSTIFLLISLMEYLFIIYEQFYILEEKSGKLFIFKLLEFVLFYGLILFNNLTSPLKTLLIIVVIRLLSFAIIATNAFALWKIKPNFKVDLKYLVTCAIISFLFLIFLF